MTTALYIGGLNESVLHEGNQGIPAFSLTISEMQDHGWSNYDLLKFVVFAKEDDISVRLPSLKGNTDAPM
jgi:hypothetical protein